MPKYETLDDLMEDAVAHGGAHLVIIDLESWLHLLPMVISTQRHNYWVSTGGDRPGFELETKYGVRMVVVPDKLPPDYPHTGVIDLSAKP